MKSGQEKRNTHKSEMSVTFVAQASAHSLSFSIWFAMTLECFILLLLNKKKHTQGEKFPEKVTYVAYKYMSNHAATGTCVSWNVDGHMNKDKKTFFSLSRREEEKKRFLRILTCKAGSWFEFHVSTMCFICVRFALPKQDKKKHTEKRWERVCVHCACFKTTAFSSCSPCLVGPYWRPKKKTQNTRRRQRKWRHRSNTRSNSDTKKNHR